jgi:hypothetical protein
MFCVSGPELLIIAFTEATKKSPAKITKAFEEDHSCFNPKPNTTANAPTATPPSRNNLGTFTGSVTVPVTTTTAIRADPIPKMRAIVLSAT